MSKNVVIMGAGGHAKMIADIIIKSGDMLYGFLDDNIPIGTKILQDYAVVGKIEDCNKLQNEKELHFIIGIGDNHTRETIYEKYKVKYYTAIHPTAVIARDVTIGEGTVIKSNATIDVLATIGKNCIVGTGSITAHDSKIGDYVHLSPNATICGTVNVGKYTHIGANATVINNINVASDCIVGAGAVVVKDIEQSGTYVGVPAKKIK